jgi:hypothetical protein
VTVFARTATFQGRPDTIDAGVSYLSDDAVPAILAMPRCIGLSVLADRRTGLCIITTAWPTREAMHGSVVAIRPIRERTAKILVAVAELEEWEVPAVYRKEGAPKATCARVTYMRAPSGTADELIDDFTTVTVPALRAIRGFCGASLLVNKEWGRAAVSVAYDSPEAAERRLSRSDGRHQLGTDIIFVRDFDVLMPHLRVPEPVAE